MAIESGEKLSEYERMCRFAVFGIKTSGVNNGGINKQLFLEKFRIPINNIFRETLSELEGDELIEENNGFIRLTLSGLIIAEEIATRFYSEDVQRKLKEVKDSFGRNGL